VRGKLQRNSERMTVQQKSVGRPLRPPSWPCVRGERQVRRLCLCDVAAGLHDRLREDIPFHRQCSTIQETGNMEHWRPRWPSFARKPFGHSTRLSRGIRKLPGSRLVGSFAGSVLVNARMSTNGVDTSVSDHRLGPLRDVAKRERKRAKCISAFVFQNCVLWAGSSA